MNPEHCQLDYGLRFDWGFRGAEAIAAGVDVAVVVDVLSFTTTLSVAADAGIDVLPFSWNDERAFDYARAADAVLAVRRSVAAEGQISLSPKTIRAAAVQTDRTSAVSGKGVSVSVNLGGRRMMNKKKTEKEK